MKFESIESIEYMRENTARNINYRTTDRQYVQQPKLLRAQFLASNPQNSDPFLAIDYNPLWVVFEQGKRLCFRSSVG